MKRIQDAVGRELEWMQPSAMKRAFELRDGDEVIATLAFRSTFGSFATARTAEGGWTMKRVGFWRTHVTICPEGSENVIATFHNATWSSGGTLEIAGARALRASNNFWMTKYEFKDENEEPLLRFHRFRGAFHRSCRVEILPRAAVLPELPWIVAFGWYLSLKMQDDAAAGGAAAAAAAAG